MKHNFTNRIIALFLALACVVGLLPLSASADSTLSDAPDHITQISSDYMYVGNRPVRYATASAEINGDRLPYVFDEQVSVPGLDTPARALCSYHAGSLGNGANGQRWNFYKEVNSPSLNVLLTYVYSFSFGSYTEAGAAAGVHTWGESWCDLWFVVAQAMTWYYEYGLLIDCTTDKEGFTEQVACEFLAAYNMYHDARGWAPWITDWNSVGAHDIIDSSDGGETGNTAYDFASAGINLVLDHPEYFHKYHLWEYKWDDSQPWRLSSNSGIMQRLLIAVPDQEDVAEPISLTVKKLEAGTDQPLAGVTFKIENAVNPVLFSVTRTTGADGTITLTDAADNLSAGQYTITETATPAGYLPQPISDTVTVLPGDTASSTFTYYNTPISGSGSIRKIDANNQTVGLPGAVIRITSIELDNGGSFSGTYTTKEGGYISEEDLDLSNLPTGSYLAEEITPPSGYTLNTDPAKVRQTFTWDGIHNVNLVFEDYAKARIQLKKVDESGAPLAGAIFVVRKDGEVIATKTTDATGTITVSHVTEGYYEFVEVSAPEGYACGNTPAGVHVNNADLQSGEPITITATNYRKRGLTIQKRDAETGDPVPGATFHVRGVNVAFEQDVTTGANGSVTLSSLPSGCYEVTETSVPVPWILDTNNRRTVWLDAGQGADASVIFHNSQKPGLRLVKTDCQTGQPVAGAAFLIEQVHGGYSEQHVTDENGLIVLEGLTPGAYVVTEVSPAPGYVADDTPHTVLLEENRTTTLELTNIKQPSLRILKYDQQTKKPLEGVTFEIYRDGDLLTTQTTDKNGEILLSHAEPGTYLVQEIAADDAHVVDSTPQSILIKEGKVQTIRFYNQKQGVIVVKKLDSVTGKPLAGVEFQITYSDGRYLDDNYGHTSSKGLYTTDSSGEIRISGVVGTLVITETKTLPGYVIDEASRTQTVQVNAADTQTITFYNTPAGNFELIKVSANDTTQRIPNVTFEIRRVSDGGLVDTITTGSDGRVSIQLDAGNYYAVEIECPREYKLDNTPHYFSMTDGKTTTLTVKNTPLCAILIHKTDSTTGKGIYGATFVLYDSTHTPIGQYSSDDQGYVRMENLTASGRYYVKELDDPGYVVDTQLKTVYVKAGETTMVEWQNTPITGQIQIVKTSADYNPTNGWPAGSPIPGTVFEIYDRAGNLVDTIQTDKNGVASSNPLPLGRYQVIESQSADFYLLDTTPMDAEIEFAGQIVRLAMTNRSVSTGVSIAKTGYSEVMPGQRLRYTFSGIANTSNVSLTSFYWRDALPVEAVRLAQITTGTYSADGSYKIVYATNLGGGYRLLADSLNTRQSYVLDASPTALGLASNEYVTEVMFVFGVVPAGFRQVEAPMIDCTVLSTVTNGLQFVNQADVGGIYNGQWVQAISRWTTKVYAPTTPQTLPRTGY